MLGVLISPVDENTFQLFAPNQLAMDEAKDKIEELLQDEVRSSWKEIFKCWNTVT